MKKFHFRASDVTGDADTGDVVRFHLPEGAAETDCAFLLPQEILENWIISVQDGCIEAARPAPWPAGVPPVKERRFYKPKEPI